jgi:hypothetical protein
VQAGLVPQGICVLRLDLCFFFPKRLGLWLLHHKLTGSPNSPKLVGPEWKSLYVPRFDASSWCGNNAEISWYDSLKANTTTTESTTGVQLLNFTAFIHDVTFHVARDFRRYQVAQSPVCNDAERVKKTRVTLTDRTGQDTIALRKTQLHCSELNRQFEKNETLTKVQHAHARTERYTDLTCTVYERCQQAIQLAHGRDIHTHR